jgi:CBS domain containing-hemolysin-like protein
MEDILEQIVGEIEDEFDESEQILPGSKEKGWEIDGNTLINDLCKTLDLDISYFEDEREEADSIAGLILEKTGQIPEAGIIVEINDIKFTVLKSNLRRIETVRVEFK